MQRESKIITPSEANLILGADGRPIEKNKSISAKEAQEDIEKGKNLDNLLSPEEEVAKKVDPDKAAKMGKATTALKVVKAVMDAIDDLLKVKKLSRQERKAFWKNFYERGEFREDVFAELMEKEDLVDTAMNLV